MPSPLTDIDDAALCAAYRAGSREAGDVLVRRYEVLVRYYGRRYYGASLDYSEACQVVRLALLRAALRYDSTLSAFPTYARRWIRGMIQRAHQSARVVVVPYHVQYEHARVDPTDTEPCLLPALPIDDVYYDETASDGAFLDDAPTPEEAMIFAEEAQTVTAALATLVTRERRILHEHVMNETKTLREIGADLGVSGEYVRQIQDKALRRLQVRLKHAA